MGKAPKLLTILVDSSMRDWPEILKLAAQGHTIDYMDDGYKADLVLAPNAHRMNEDIRKHLTEAIGEARRIKYPSKGKGKDNDT